VAGHGQAPKLTIVLPKVEPSLNKSKRAINAAASVAYCAAAAAAVVEVLISFCSVHQFF
jgi:hypothetical protein